MIERLCKHCDGWHDLSKPETWCDEFFEDRGEGRPREDGSAKNHSFKPRWIENLGPEPVYVTSHAQHKELMRKAKCEHIGSFGHKEAVERSKDRSAQIKRLQKEARKNGDPRKVRVYW